ncbi:MAG: cupin domain-containing protein [Anaerolineales bacterium]
MMGKAGRLHDCSAARRSAEIKVGERIRKLRRERGFSLRALAKRSGLNVNTLSMVENGKTSPSVSTLQQLAQALDVPIVSFFESQQVEKTVVFTPADRRPEIDFGRAQIQNLGEDLAGNAVQPFVVTLQPGAASGEQTIVHTGHEFVYCLSGLVRYQIDGQSYLLEPGDSLVFEAHLPHCWENAAEEPAQILLIFYPADRRDQPGGRHFKPRQELATKIAFITEDGKTISRHFGRAPYYLVMTIEDGQIIQREMREKLGHGQFAGGLHGEHEHHHGAGHEPDTASHNKHVSMAQAITDCEAVICGGMGMGAYESMRRLNIRPIVTELSDIETAAQAYIAGTLTDHPEMLH